MKTRVSLLGLMALLALLCYGCGGSRSDEGIALSSPATTAATPARSRLLVSHQILTRAVPATITQFRLTVLDANGQPLPGTPQVVAAQAEVTLGLDATGTHTLRLEYLAGATVVGLFETAVELGFGQTARVVDPAWIDASGTLQSLSLTAPSSQVAVNSTLQLSAIATFSDGGQSAVTTAATYSSSSAAAAVDGAGLLRGLSPGSVTVRAELFDQSGELPITVVEGASPPADPSPSPSPTPAESPIASITVTPPTATIQAGNQLQLNAQAVRADGTEVSNANSILTWSSQDGSLVTVDANGLATAVAPGTTTIMAADAATGVNATMVFAVSSPIVIGPAITLDATAHTFNTDTGQLDGTVPNGWSGTQLRVQGFDLAAGGTLTVTGSKPFDVQVTGDGTVAGTIVAAGQNGGDSGNDLPGGAAGTAGPGGFPGGAGTNVVGAAASGSGPGAGGGANNSNVSTGSNFTAGGGGAGHSVAGNAGVSNGAVAGTAGPAYASLPPLTGGSGGGGGAYEVDVGNNDGGGGGGGGGGAVRIACSGTLTVSGTIDCHGGNGGTTLGGPPGGGGGGGGSGGVIELLASTLPNTAGSTLNVAGGNGGTGPLGTDGGAGAAGRTRIATL